MDWLDLLAVQGILKSLLQHHSSMERLLLKLKLQLFGQLMRRTDSLEKTLMLGNMEGRRRKGWQGMKWLDGITDVMEMNLSRLRELVTNREVWHAAVNGVTNSWAWLYYWTELNHPVSLISYFIMLYQFCNELLNWYLIFCWELLH